MKIAQRGSIVIFLEKNGIVLIIVFTKDCSNCSFVIDCKLKIYLMKLYMAIEILVKRPKTSNLIIKIY